MKTHRVSVCGDVYEVEAEDREEAQGEAITEARRNVFSKLHAMHIKEMELMERLQTGWSPDEVFVLPEERPTAQACFIPPTKENLSKIGRGDGCVVEYKDIEGCIRRSVAVWKGDDFDYITIQFIVGQKPVIGENVTGFFRTKDWVG